MVTNTELKSALEQIDRIERELADLKERLANGSGIKRKPLKGLLKGLKFTDGEIEGAKRSWLKHDE